MAISSSSTSSLSPSTGTGAGYRYPQAMITSGTDYVRFDFKKYAGPFSGSTGDADSVDGYNASISSLVPAPGLQSVYLYMPEDVSADYGASWGGKSFSNIGAGILKGLGPTLASGNVGASAQNAMEAVQSQVAGFGPALAASKIAEELNKIPGAGGGVSIDDVLSGTRGVILNPNAELMFQNAEMRTFNLSFKMVARSEPESIAIKNICYVFKKAALPTFGGEGLSGKKSANFIGVPAVVDVNFMKGGSLNPYVPQFKPSAITNVKVNLTPDGAYATYTSGAPVSVQLDLSFAELKLVFADEIKDSGWSY